jgi:DNA-binding transcriptional ArsR family regulator
MLHIARKADVDKKEDRVDSSVWRALADPTRRAILDLLRERPRITGDISSYFEISRIAVMRHLDVLAAAGLVTSRKQGRERWHYLNAIPLQRIHDRWVHAQAEPWAARLLRLRAKAAGDRMTTEKPGIDVALDVSIEASQSDAFHALTRDTGGWWGHPFVSSGATSLVLEPRLGGLLIEQRDGGGSVLAAVSSWTDDRHLELTGPFHLGLAVGIAVFELLPADDGTSLQFSFRAFGPIEGSADQYANGWRELVAVRLKTLVETGKRLGINPDPPKKEVRR